MESCSNIDLENLSVLLTRNDKIKDLEIQPTPYTFTKLENGKKTVVDSNSIAPPSWLLLDHTIAVVWLMFSSNSSSHQLNINDLKWAYEFLKEIRNNRGENPPDVKTCLKEIQDRLINLYAKLTNMKEKNINQISFGEKFFEESKSYLMAPKIFDCDKMSLASSLYPSRTTIRLEYPSLNRHSTKDITVPKQKRINFSKTSFPLLSKNSNIFEDSENDVDDEEVEKYVLSLFNEDRKEELSRCSKKSFIPTKKKIMPGLSISGVMPSRDSFSNLSEKPTKRLVAEMRSLKFQKSMKVQDTNGEEAAYSNLKAEIRRLTLNPDVSTQIKKFVKEWRTEQVDRLHNELTRLNSIEKIIKSIDEAQPNLENLSINLKEVAPSRSNNSLSKSFLA